jgi:hypothetical protein
LVKNLRFWSTVVGLTTGSIALVTFLFTGASGATAWLASFGEADLPATYPNETWRKAKPAQYEWLLQDWCFPTLGDFKVQFRQQGGNVVRRNSSTRPAVDTGWMDVTVYISNRDLLRIYHHRDGMPGSYLRPATTDNLSLYENERRQSDAGEISSTRQILALHCTRCQISSDSITYSCD